MASNTNNKSYNSTGDWEYDCGDGSIHQYTETPPAPTVSTPKQPFPPTNHHSTAPNAPPRHKPVSRNLAATESAWGVNDWGTPSLSQSQTSLGDATWTPHRPGESRFFPRPNATTSKSRRRSPPPLHAPPRLAPTREPPKLNLSPSAFDTQQYYEDMGYGRTLRMRYALDDTTLYLSVPDVFQHVTLGGRLSTHDLCSLGEFVRDRVFQDREVYSKTTIRKSNPLDGTYNDIRIIPYRWEDYGAMALACLEWAHQNSDHVVFPSYP